MRAREGDRIAQLESEIRSFKYQLAAKTTKAFPLSDPAFKQISFLGFPKGFARQYMIAEMERAARERLVHLCAWGAEWGAKHFHIENIKSLKKVITNV